MTYGEFIKQLPAKPEWFDKEVIIDGVAIDTVHFEADDRLHIFCLKTQGGCKDGVCEIPFAGTTPFP